MTTKLKWRLADRPTPSEISLLVEKDLLTKDEAREILFSLETEEDRDKKSLESEIKFLRELVEKLSQGRHSTIVETIRYVEKPYQQYPWYQPYQVWCGQTQSIGAGQYLDNSTGLNAISNSTSQAFNQISTF